MDDRSNDSLLTKAVAQVKKALPEKKQAQGEQFARLLLARIDPAEFSSRTAADWAGMIAGFLTFAQRREPGRASVRIFNPSREEDGWETSHTVIQIVNDDMPFLVDSASMAAITRDMSIHMLMHPLIRVDRNGWGGLRKIYSGAGQGSAGRLESFIHMEIDRQTEPALLKKLESNIKGALMDVRAAVEDWKPMRSKMLTICGDLKAHKPPVSAELQDEAARFLNWLAKDHFTFLGYREYEVADEEDDQVLRAVPSTGLGILKQASRKGSRRSIRELARQAEELKREPEPIIITKTNARATVHRQGYMDYVGILHYGRDGAVIGEQRFIGLYTSSAYNQRPWEIPIVRRKVEGVMARSELRRQSHAGKAMWHILETLPRDELFQAAEDELYEMATGILNLQERQHTKLFVRRDRFGRFFSCLVYIPRDRYNTEVRLEIQRILKRAFKGVHVDYSLELAESALARVYIVVRPKPGERVTYDGARLERKLERAVRSWNDELRDILIEKSGEEKGIQLSNRFGPAFPAAYKEDVAPRVASYDVEQLAAIEGPGDIRMSLYKPRRQRVGSLRFKIFKQGKTIQLSEALPMLENMGLTLISERPYEVKLADNTRIWIQDFDMNPIVADNLDLAKLRDKFQRAFEGIYRGEIEDDGFNRLILYAGLDWRQVTVLRAYCKFLLQARTPFSQRYMEQTLTAHPEISRRLVALFDARFNPARDKDRDKLQSRLVREFDTLLEHVSSLDEDRILRGFMGAVLATVRTNFYRQPGGQGAIAFKIQSDRLPELPKPRPFMEIFVCSPRVEAVHLRTGLVARGGLRWSDRREDFRTEVLGLMKAQNVKNTLIVPVGAKGGFVVKRIPQGNDVERIRDEVVDCYRSFIGAMLDLTDDYDNGNIEHPGDVVRHDGDDPYLVVAADKGTATFSDIANEIASQHGYWLDDAFASGGSHGYDHKKLGITARGAWESVKRHFRELGVDTQTDPVTVVGIGDMAGDVFGNGMLLSEHIRLKGAFNHQHIFLDPDPDPKTGFQERQRLFQMPRSTWEDYDEKLISKGGGIYSRSAKTIELSEAVRGWLGIEALHLTPQELIRELLKAPVDLLWNGGIGTYVKAEAESHADVGDRSNDNLRVNGGELRCKVAGEGGNLGFTQRGRVEYALKGGKLNTDFIDNSAGVDCSDHEVNIKILLNNAMNSAGLTFEARNKLLVEMKSEVTRLVLRNNYLQSQAISMMEAQSERRLGELRHFIDVLERRGTLDRDLEFLPDEDQLRERRAMERGLTRPELALLLAYSKISIHADLLESDVPEDPFLAKELVRYFPKPLQDKYGDLMKEHRLRREIIATTITNSMVNRMGAAFALRLREDTGASPADIAKAYTIAREVLNARQLWQAIEDLDTKVPSSVQTEMILYIWRLLRHATRWFIVHLKQDFRIADVVERYQSGVEEIAAELVDMFKSSQFKSFRQVAGGFTKQSVPKALATRIATLSALYSSLDIVDVAVARKLPVKRVMHVYFRLGRLLSLRWLQAQVDALPVERQWHAQARGALRDELYRHHRELTAQVLHLAGAGESSTDPVDSWRELNRPEVSHVKRMFQDMRTFGSMDYATVTVAIRSLQQLLREM